jgi:hypothetical protein
VSHAVDVAAADVREESVTARVTFDELCMERWLATRNESRADGPHRRAYTAAVRSFEEEEGRMVQAWWSASAPGGVALTVRPTSALRSVVGAQSGASLHRATDWTMRDFPQVAAALHEADGLAIRAGEILRGTSQRIALTHLFAAVVSLLGVVERIRLSGAGEGDEDTTGEGLQEAVAHYRRNLLATSAYYQQAAARATQIFYFWGMLVGVGIIAGLTALVAVGVDLLLGQAGIEVSDQTFALMLTAASAGALGACVSAMWRISSGDFHADYEAGSTHARTIGSFRPFIGAVFGMGLYVALRAGFMPTLQEEATDFYLAAFVAFLGGFSERLAPDVFAKAEKEISSDAGPRGDRGGADRPPTAG